MALFGRGPRRAVTVYTRQGCHLCQEAEAVVRRVARRHDIRIVDVDVDADPAITERYTVRVPVIEVDGTEIAEFSIDAGTLRAALRA